jgi:SAM-dependent methyltransferase
LTISRDIGFYDEGWTDQWRDMKRFSPMGRHTRRWILKLLKRLHAPLSIADIGCGDGSLLSEISRVYPHAALYGVDSSRVAIDICQHRIPTGTFSIQDICHDPVTLGRSVDVAINSEVLEHVPDDEAALRHMAKCCRYLIITVPGGRLDENAQQMGHLRHYDESSLTALVERVGLEVLYCRSWGCPFAYPFYAQLRNQARHGALTGRYGWRKRAIAHMLYGLFYLNDLFGGGNKIFLLAINPACEGRD